MFVNFTAGIMKRISLSITKKYIKDRYFCLQRSTCLFEFGEERGLQTCLKFSAYSQYIHNLFTILN